MSTTSQFQILPDFYSSPKECEEYSRKKQVTNNRYKDFNQTHFTAGDKYQFEEYRDMTNENLNPINIDPINNIFHDIYPKELIDWECYRRLPATCVDNTFSYIFNKFKKGIFVKIKDNKLKVFLPFSKNNFENEWGDIMKYDPSKYKSMNDFLEKISTIQGYRFNPSKINQNTKSWYANNCLVRFEYPLSEGDSGVHHMSDMFKTLCESRKVPDIEFFINRRDFPILKKDKTEPYNNIFNSENVPLISHNYEKYSPILGGSITKKYADISIPTWKDWARISAFEGKFFIKTCDELLIELKEVEWSKRLPTAIFRGGSTGCGTTKDTNPRLKLAYLSKITKVEDGYPLLDAGITKWNLRPRKHQGNLYLQTIDINKEAPLVKYLTAQEQCNYKYIINVDGHVTAFRLSLELSMGSVILLGDSEYTIWFMKYLEPYKHYIPIKKDLSNLVEIIRWCRKNDEQCKKISENAKIFYLKYLNKNSILDYLQMTLINLKSIMGTYIYNTSTPLQIQLDYESKMLKSYKYFPSTSKTINDINSIPIHGRYYSTLKGLEWIYNLIKMNVPNIEEYFKISDKSMTTETKNTKIYKSKLAKYDIMIKYSKTKNIESIHEAFIGFNCINKLSKKIPNFEYIFGTYEINGNICICAEFIDGIKFSDYLNSSFFNFTEFAFILIQILLAISVAQKECSFVHGDLMPWNIIIKKLNSPIIIDYVLDYNNIVSIKTDVLAIIIDYGRSHAIHNGIHYGLYDMFETSTINDSIMILLKSIDKILEKRVDFKDVSSYITLANFVSNTKYNPIPFTNITELRMFLNQATKYSTLLSTNKYELESKTPIDLVKYILKNFNIPNVNNINSTNYINKNIGNSKQVFEYILCTTNEDRIQTYLDIFNIIIKCDIDVNNNMFLLYYINQMREQQSNNNYTLLKSFLQNNKLDITKYDDIYKLCKSNIIDTFKRKNENSSLLELILDFDEKLYTSNMKLYTNITFLDPTKIYNIIIDSKSKKYKDFTLLKSTIEYVLLNNGTYKIDVKTKEFYIKNFAKLLSCNNVYMLNNTANINTIIEMSRELYTKDKEYILQNNISDLSINYVQYYDEILELTKEKIIIL